MQAKRKKLCGTLLIMLVVFTALIETAFAYIPCQCDNPPEKCTCFIQLGDKGKVVKNIIDVLRAKGYIGKLKKNAEFTPEVRKAVLNFQADHDLECNGWMDDETLDALLYDILPDKSVKPSDEIWSETFWDTICYVPTDGGEKHHVNPFCCGMLNPRLISRKNAMSLGILPCGKRECKKVSYLTYSSLGLKPRLLPDEYYEEDESFTAFVAAVGNDTDIERSLPSSDKVYIYIGNKRTNLFHYSNCSHVSKMSEKNKIEFLSRSEAIEQGFTPCSTCNP